MATTAKGLRYPGLSDQPHGPDQIEDLASDVDTQLGAESRTSDPSSPYVGKFHYRTDQKRAKVYDGTAHQDIGGLNSFPYTTITNGMQQPGAFTSTLTWGYYSRRGLNVFVAMKIVMTASGIAGNELRCYPVGLPVPFESAIGYTACGTFRFFDLGSTVYTGCVNILHDGSNWFLSFNSDAAGGSSFGVTPSVGAASGDVLECSFEYRPVAL